ncbi:hypothetical protein QEN19_001168 [Hanseniaspora menglaensis]
MTTSEAVIVSRSLFAIVDIGSNGIRFSISSRASHHARIMPSVYKDRLGISLFDVQYQNGQQKRPIPNEIITEICHAMLRFKLICEDFGVGDESVEVVATESTRDALNCDDLIKEIESAAGWKVNVFNKKQECDIGCFGVISSFNLVSGLFVDIGGGSFILSWIQCKDGVVRVSDSPVYLPYGAGALTRRLQTEDTRSLFSEIKKVISEAIYKIGMPEELLEHAKRTGGFDVYSCGGGMRSLGHLLISQEEKGGYPIQTIINGYVCSAEKFNKTVDYLLLKGHIPGNDSTKIFKVSEKRSKQLPAIGLLMSAVCDALPPLKSMHFCDGGVREGLLYSRLPDNIRSQDPILISTQPYAPLRADKYLAILKSSLPQSGIPRLVVDRVAPALCNLAFVHAGYPKELQSTAALHVADTGIIAGCHGLSHKIRALVDIALSERWGGDIPENENIYKQKLENLIMEQRLSAAFKGTSLNYDTNVNAKIIWWTRYIGVVMFLICGVNPGGNIRDNVFSFSIKETNDRHSAQPLYGKTTKTSSQVATLDVVIRLNKDDLKTSASVRSRIMILQKKVRKLSKGGAVRARVSVEYL